VDPVVADGGNMRHFNRYAHSNPYKFTDPDGRQPVAVIPAVITQTAKGAAGSAAFHRTGVRVSCPGFDEHL